jgi:hypothetical protein
MAYFPVGYSTSLTARYRSFLQMPNALIQSKCSINAVLCLTIPKQCVRCISYEYALGKTPQRRAQNKQPFFFSRPAPVYPCNPKSYHRVEPEAASSLVLGTTRLASLLKLGALGCLNANSSILGMSSPIRNGFDDGYDRDVAFEVSRFLQFADLAGALQAVHDGHFLVHEDDAEVDGIGRGLLPVGRVLKGFEGFATVVGDACGDAVVVELPLQDFLVD